MLIIAKALKYVDMLKENLLLCFMDVLVLDILRTM